MIKFLYSITTATVLGVLASALYWQTALPDQFQMINGSVISLPGNVTAVFSEEGNLSEEDTGKTSAELVLPLGVSVKTVDVQKIDREMVFASGKPFGIKMFTRGLMVVGMSDFAVEGQRTNPGRQAGIETGDILISLDGITLVSNEQFGSLVQSSGGKKMLLVYQRDEKEYRTWITPCKNASDNAFHLGIWVRDSSAGIGTITYFDAVGGWFTGLGHAICDVDTGDIMTLSSGEAVEAAIVGCIPGKKGSPGELKGQFVLNREFGTLKANTEVGIFGVLREGYRPDGRLVPLALSHEVHTGSAVILTTIEGSTPREYAIEIEKILRTNGKSGQNMVIRITDETLLTKTGGIIQGMSGSPILQDGMLVGAVTHVFVNEPNRGYGVFAENIHTMEKGLEKQQKEAA